MALASVIPAFPVVERGRPSQIKLNPKRDQLVYGFGRMVVLRDVVPPAGSSIKTQLYIQHSYPVSAVDVSPSGCYVASGDESGVVRVWACDNPDQILKLETSLFGGKINDLAWSPDNQRIVGVGDGKQEMGKVIMWDSGNSVGSISGHAKQINSCAYKSTRPFRIVTGGEDNKVNYFEGPPFKFKATAVTHSRFVNTVRYSPDGAHFFSTSSDMTIGLFDGKTGEAVAECPTPKKVHAGSIYSACWSADSTKIFTCSGDGTAKVFQVPTLAEEAVISFPEAEATGPAKQLVGCAWAGAGLLTYSLGGILSLRTNAADAAPALNQYGHSKPIFTACLDPSTGKLLAGSFEDDFKTSSIRAQLRAWDLSTGLATAYAGETHKNKIIGMGVCPSGVITCGADGTLCFSSSPDTFGNMISLGLEGEAPTGFGCGRAICATVTSKDRLLVTTIPDGKSVPVQLPYSPTAVALAASDSQLAVGGADNIVHVLGADGAELFKLERHRDAISCLAFSADCAKLASGCANKEIVIWSTVDGSALVTGLSGFHTARISCFAWSAAGVLASGGVDAAILVWDLDAKSPKNKMVQAHVAGAVTALVFTEETTLVSAGMDSCIKSWKL